MKQNYIDMSIEYKTITADDLKSMMANGLKLTPAQKKIADRLVKGDVLFVENEHHRNGGTYMWLNTRGGYKEWASTVYKAFWNIEYAIRKFNGEYVSMGGSFLWNEKEADEWIINNTK